MKNLKSLFLASIIAGGVLITNRTLTDSEPEIDRINNLATGEKQGSQYTLKPEVANLREPISERHAIVNLPDVGVTNGFTLEEIIEKANSLHRESFIDIETAKRIYEKTGSEEEVTKLYSALRSVANIDNSLNLNTELQVQLVYGFAQQRKEFFGGLGYDSSKIRDLANYNGSKLKELIKDYISAEREWVLQWFNDSKTVTPVQKRKINVLYAFDDATLDIMAQRESNRIISSVNKGEFSFFID